MTLLLKGPLDRSYDLAFQRWNTDSIPAYQGGRALRAGPAVLRLAPQQQHLGQHGLEVGNAQVRKVPAKGFKNDSS